MAFDIVPPWEPGFPLTGAEIAVVYQNGLPIGAPLSAVVQVGGPYLPLSGGALSGPLAINLPGGGVSALVVTSQAQCWITRRVANSQIPQAGWWLSIDAVQGFDGQAYASTTWVLSAATENWSATGHGGDLAFSTTANGTTTTRAAAGVTNGGSFWVGPSGALAVGATEGFFVMPGMPGAPTGVPNVIATSASLAGKASSVYDTTNQALWVYSGNWRSVPLALSTLAANQVLASPGAAAGRPVYRSLVGADLPNPAATAKGGVLSQAPLANQFLTGISTAGAPTLAQPSTANLSDRDAAFSTWTVTPSIIGTLGDGVFSAVSSTTGYRRLGFLVLFWMRVIFTFTYTTAVGTIAWSLPVTPLGSAYCGPLILWPSAASPAANGNLLAQVSSQGLTGLIVGNNYFGNSFGTAYGLASGQQYGFYLGGIYSTA